MEELSSAVNQEYWKNGRVTENKGEGYGKNEVMKEEVRSNQERHGSLLSDYREAQELPLKTQGSKSHVEFPFTQTINEFCPRGGRQVVKNPQPLPLNKKR